MYTCAICNRRFAKEINLTNHKDKKSCKPQITIDERNRRLAELLTKTKIDRALLEKNKREIAVDNIIVDTFINTSVNTIEITEEIVGEVPVANIMEIYDETVNEIIVEETADEIIAEETVICKNKLIFDGIFKGRESEIRITEDNKISVFDFIRVVGGQKDSHLTWKRLLNEHKDEVRLFCTKAKFKGLGQKLTPVVNAQGMVKILFWLPGESARQFRGKSAETIVRYLGGVPMEPIIEVVEKIEEVVDKIVACKNKLIFDGIFKGRESEIRITPDNKISIFDFIRVVGGQKNPKSTWERLQEKYKNEVYLFCDYFNFKGQGQKLTPVVNAQGMIKILFWLPGESARQFRSKSAETMVRYLGGDITLINDIKTINQEHINNPNNIAQVFRNEIQPQNVQQVPPLQITNIFNQDQINISNQLVSYFGNKNDIFYMFIFKRNNVWYVKYGIVGEVREFYIRLKEHKIEFEDICFLCIFQCKNIDKVESDFKATALVVMNKVKIPKKNGGNHTEILKLSELVTTSVIKEEMIRIAGDRMIDPMPPSYQDIESKDLEIEYEHTKQKEIECKQKEIECTQLTKQKEIECVQLTKQKEIECTQLTKQKEIELEMRKLDYEMKKLEFEMKKIGSTS